MKKVALVLIFSFLTIQTFADCFNYRIGVPVTGKRESGASFTIGDTSYHFFGNDGFGLQSSLYTYNHLNDSTFGTWNSIGLNVVDCPQVRDYPISGVINGMAYVGLGNDQNGVYFNDLHRFNPTTLVFDSLANFPGNQNREDAISFTLNNKLYYGLGNWPYDMNPIYFSDLWEYDPQTDVWTLVDSSYSDTSSVVNFIANGEFYIQGNHSFQRYSPITNTWINLNNKSWTLGGNGFSNYPTNDGYVFYYNNSVVDIYRYEISSDSLVYQCSGNLPSGFTFTEVWSGNNSIYFEAWDNNPQNMNDEVYRYDLNNIITSIDAPVIKIDQIYSYGGNLYYNGECRLINVYNMQGQLVKIINTNGLSGVFNLGLPSGIYVVKTNNTSKKLIVD